MNVQAMLAAKQKGSKAQQYIEDVFSTTLYNGTSATPQSVNTGIDLAGKGGMVWLKTRNGSFGHWIMDTVRGPNVGMRAENESGNLNLTGYFTGFNNNGFSVAGETELNSNNAPYVAWTFRKAKKFFDVIAYAGNGDYSRLINHALGVMPGMILVKRTDAPGDWFVLAYNGSNAHYVSNVSANFGLNLNNASNTLFTTVSNYFTPTTFRPTGMLSNGDMDPAQRDKVNAAGASYVAYLFAHDPSPDGLIQCGSFVANNGSASVNLGWEPQYVLIKSVSTMEQWIVFDNMRGMPVGSNDTYLSPNMANAESSMFDFIDPTATGFNIKNMSGTQTYMFMAIRRGPMRKPTSGYSVLGIRSAPSDQTASSNIGMSFDAIFSKRRGSSAISSVVDRLRGLPTSSAQNKPVLRIESAGVEANTTSDHYWAVGEQNGMDILGWTSPASEAIVGYALKRQPGVFDIVCYAGSSSALDVAHNLQAIPELIIMKSRDLASSSWYVAHSITDTTYGHTYLNAGDATSTFNYGTLTLGSKPTASSFNLRGNIDVNASGYKNVAYLFASLAGVSKVGSYTGNGTSLTVDCGFSNGARFLMIKRKDASGDWFVWDTARGIVAGNDPRISWNNLAAEQVADDSVDPTAVGFIVNQVAATGINVSGAAYIFLAIA